ncbi:DinB family protein [Kribbella sp. VKM Ac-2571]|uniref:DinB family protein n=1 Tax=Kribbella sp. VKM Ac-2571 TaxID=2512222 RepID=UPI00141520AD|nr:DinB family protein [Kribbella sp. VKM Ac-2571]
MPNRLADERDALTQQLDFHRATLLRKLEGLEAEPLRRPMTPSGLSLLGLVKHLAETEHGWFVKIYAGLAESDLFPTDGDPDADFRVGPDETADVVVGQYLRTCERARAVVAAGELDDVVTTPSGAEANLRAILVHMIQETARHNGHADIIRESLDGTTGH